MREITSVRDREEYAWIKPQRGFWTSSLNDGTTGWIDWCEGEEFSVPDETWSGLMLTPRPDARVLCIDTHEDLCLLTKRYGLFCPSRNILHQDLQGLTFEGMAADGWDAMHLTDAGQWATRMTHPLSLYGWDCESTVWFRWAFDNASPWSRPVRQLQAS